MTDTVRQSAGLYRRSAKRKGETKQYQSAETSPVVTLNNEDRFITTMIPDVSGNTMRALLRKMICLYIFEKMTGIKIDYDTLVAMYQGGSGLVKDTTSSLVDRLRRIEKLKQTNVVISLFGASLSGTITPGKAVVHDVVPVCIETLRAGILCQPAGSILMHTKQSGPANS